MLPRVLFLLLVAIGVGVGGYYAYHSYYQSPSNTVIRATQQFSQLKTVHGDMDITYNIQATSSAQATQSKISGFSDLDIPDKTQKMHMTITSASSSLDMDMILLKAGQMYLKIPALTENWISLNTQTLKDQGDLPVDPQSSDYVTQSLGFLKSINQNSIVKLEDEVVDGIKSSHFRVDVSTPQYLSYLKQISTSSTLTNAFKNADITLDIWIDQSNNYIVKTQSVVKNLDVLDKNNNSLGSANMTMMVSYSKYDAPVDISKPDGTIVDYATLLKQAQTQQAQQQQAAAQASSAQAASPVAPSNCEEMNIREGEFASDKCYAPRDYDDLNYYIGAFDSAANTYNGATADMQITCNGSDFFKNQCAQDKQTQSDSQANITKYRGIIQGIIAKGH